MTANVPKQLYQEIQKRVAESLGTFKNVEEYVEFVLTEMLKVGRLAIWLRSGPPPC